MSNITCAYIPTGYYRLHDAVWEREETVPETGSCVVLHDVNYTYPCLHALQPDVQPLCDVPRGCRLGNAVSYE